MEQFARQNMLLGHQSQQILANSHVAVFGLGGVGSYCVEALARAGVGKLTLVDDDVISITNLNRQLYALHSTVGQKKVDVATKRVLDINPNCTVQPLCLRFDQTTASQLDFSSFSYVVDAIDSVQSKVLLAELCHQTSTPIVASMGTGNKLDGSAFQVADLFSTTVCPLAKVMRKLLKQRGVPRLKVVFSREEPRVAVADAPTDNGKPSVGSVSFVPPVAGLLLAGEVIKDLCKE